MSLTDKAVGPAPVAKLEASNSNVGFAASAVAITAMLALPMLGSAYTVSLATEVLIAGLFASGLNVLIGYTGLVSLGHAMFFGIGGYVVGAGTVLWGLPLWLAIVVTVPVTALIATATGMVCTRTRGTEFLLITLAFSQMAYGVALKLSWTGGSDGMNGIPRPDFSGFGLSGDDPTVFYGYAAVVTVLSLGILRRVLLSPVGSVFVGIRESERRMTALGYDVAVYKVAAFIISAVVAAIAGLLQAQYTYFINPDAMSWQFSGEVVLMVIMGGRRWFLGPLLGATVFIVVKQALSLITGEYIVFFGLFFMAVVAFLPDGFAGAIFSVARRWRWKH